LNGKSFACQEWAYLRAQGLVGAVEMGCPAE
jgi:hypothetical protein